MYQTFPISQISLLLSFPFSRISQASNIFFPFHRFLSPLSPTFTFLPCPWRIPRRERPPAAHEKREFHASILWRRIKKETVTHYRLHSPSPDWGRSPQNDRRCHQSRKWKKFLRLRGERLAQERTRKNLLFSFVHDSNTLNQHLLSIKKEETNSRSIFPAFTIFFIINPRFLLRKVKVCSFCVLNLIFNRTTNLNLSNYKNQNLESVHFQIHYQLLSTHGTAGIWKNFQTS